MDSSSSSPRPVTRTASRCIQETARGTHVFTVDGFSLHSSLGAGEYVESGVFVVGGYEWRLRYYPDRDNDIGADADAGDDDDGERCISFVLQLLSKGVEVHAFFSFRLLNHETGRSQLVYSTSERHVFDNTGRKIGYGDHAYHDTGGLITRGELEESAFLRDDRLVIECDVTVIKRLRVIDRDHRRRRRPSPPASDLSMDIVRMLRDKVGTDVLVNVAGEVIAAHGVVLAARSPVFKAQLYGLMRPTVRWQQKQIAVHDMQPVVFRELLHFMYTDSISLSTDSLDRGDKTEMIKNLLVAADRYAVDKLKKICEDSLCECLNVENVVSMFAMADQHSCYRLKDACAEFMASWERLDRVVDSREYGRLKRSSPALLLDAVERAVKSQKIREETCCHVEPSQKMF
ncbi:BTB/POZ and MATH domain-containing protein 2-like [Oryza brachyantha]|uniref:BTB domain-containing protein n=1 Tax=Oryza brachyantha TaxID=4533 RepID=J3MRC9_ORYBR|nr:BTB/POZ and MATH domain-containing protein 2-like [Oryza brachyantha]